MTDVQKTQQEVMTPAPTTGKPFGQMSGMEKVTWVGKVAVMLVTGGFAYPNIFTE
jgi:hypothetical protein